jgi:hypothetical protein
VQGARSAHKVNLDTVIETAAAATAAAAMKISATRGWLVAIVNLGGTSSLFDVMVKQSMMRDPSVEVFSWEVWVRGGPYVTNQSCPPHDLIVLSDTTLTGQYQARYDARRVDAPSATVDMS